MKVLHKIRLARGYKYEHIKKFYYKDSSSCCSATYTPKHYLNDKPLKIDFNFLSLEDKIAVRYVNFCDKCNQKCKINWRFIHD